MHHHFFKYIRYLIGITVEDVALVEIRARGKPSSKWSKAANPLPITIDENIETPPGDELNGGPIESGAIHYSVTFLRGSNSRLPTCSTVAKPYPSSTPVPAPVKMVHDSIKLGIWKKACKDASLEENPDDDISGSSVGACWKDVGFQKGSYSSPPCLYLAPTPSPPPVNSCILLPISKLRA
jgi:hypothetical protein